MEKFRVPSPVPSPCAASSNPGEVWLALRVVEGGARWASGEPVGAGAWVPGEPNDGEGMCAKPWPAMGYQLDDTGCGWLYKSLCLI